MLCVQGTPWKQPITSPTLFIRTLNQLGCVLPTTHGSARSNIKDFSCLVEGQHITAPCHSPRSVGLSSSLSSGKRFTASAYCISATTAALRAVPASPTSGSLLQSLQVFCFYLSPLCPTNNTLSDLSVTVGLRLLGLLLHIRKCAYIHYLSTFIIA